MIFQYILYTIKLILLSQILTTDTLSCVFWNFELYVLDKIIIYTCYCICFVSSDDDATLPTGQWNTSGCTITRQDSESVSCQCDHLTHFAILLSPGVPV